MIITSQQSIYDKQVDQQDVSIPKFFKGMEKMHNVRFPSKEGLASFNLVEFSSPTIKKEHAIVSVHGQILDFDGCKCDIQTVLDVFDQYSYVAYSSFNNGKKGVGHRFRLVLPYAAPITNLHYTAIKNVYEHIFDVFADQLSHLPTGLDTSKRNPGAFYFRPCMTDHPIFHRNDGKLLDFLELVNSPRSQEVYARKLALLEAEKANQKKLEERRAERATELTPAQKDTAAANSLAKFAYQGSGTGNIQFFKYAKSLAGKGFDNHEIANLLRTNAHQFGSTEERKKEINYIIKRL